MAFTEFYCQSGGSNLNAGSTNSNSAAYTSTNGGWNAGTGVFTPTDGSNSSSTVSVGDFASVYLDAATVGVFIGRVTAVQNATNGTVTVSLAAAVGSAPGTLASGRTIKVGGAWKGPNAASGFPFSLAGFGNNKDASSHQARVNMKNDASYSISVAITMGGGSTWVTQGYSSSVGDGGKAILDGGTSVAAVIADVGIAGNLFIDFIFTTSITSGTTDLVTTTRLSSWERCVFKGARGRGVSAAASCAFQECELYDCNKSNSANLAAIRLLGGVMLRCYVHDNAGSNTDGIDVNAGATVIQNCVVDTNGKRGIAISAISNQGVIQINNTDFYNNTSDAINNASNAPNPLWIENCNFIKNGGAAINNANAVATGFVYNCGYGSGTQANGSGDTLGNLIQSGTVTYASGVTPWNAPTTGDFRISLAAAFGTGRGVFTETDGTNTGTIAYPDIGAAPHQDLADVVWNLADITFPDGYINHAFSYLESVPPDFTVSIISGSLPSGLSISQPTSHSWQISGTPAGTGTSTFVVRITHGATSGDATCHMTINDDPDEGTGGMLGG